MKPCLIVQRNPQLFSLFWTWDNLKLSMAQFEIQNVLKEEKNIKKNDFIMFGFTVKKKIKYNQNSSRFLYIFKFLNLL